MCLEHMTVDEIGDGFVQCEVEVTPELSNSYATLHGGAISTIVDVVGTMALLTKDHSRAGVSVEINCCFLNAAKVGETVSVTGKVSKYGKKLGFAEIELHSKATGKPLANGRHTKFFT